MCSTIFKTPHYEFKLTITNKQDYYGNEMQYLYFEDDVGQCLDTHISKLDTMCSLEHFDLIEESIIFENPENLNSKGIELLFAFISYVKENYPNVTEIYIHDTSYLHGSSNNRLDRTFDTLSYYISMYGKTWYEMIVGGVPKYFNDEHKIEYIEGINTYMNPETKKNTPFIDIWRQFIYNEPLWIIIKPRLAYYESFYKSCSTFSEFFKLLNKDIPLEHRCYAYSPWLASWLNQFFRITNSWKIPLYNNPVLEQNMKLSITNNT